MLAEQRRSAPRTMPRRRHAYRRPGIGHRSASLLQRREKIARDQMLVVKQILRRIEHADGQASCLALVKGGFGILNQEKALHHRLDFLHVLLAVEDT